MIYLLTSKYHAWLEEKKVKYNPSKEDFIKEYPYEDFEDLDDHEVEDLVKFRYVTNVLKTIVDRPKKGLFLDLVTRCVQNYSYKYVQGSGPSRATRLRIKIFEIECDVVPRKRVPISKIYNRQDTSCDVSPYSSDSGEPRAKTSKRKQEYHTQGDDAAEMPKVTGRRRRQNSPNEEAVALLRDAKQLPPQQGCTQNDFYSPPFLQHDQHDHMMASLSEDQNEASVIRGGGSWLDFVPPLSPCPLKSNVHSEFPLFASSNGVISTTSFPYTQSQSSKISQMSLLSKNQIPSNQSTPVISSSPFAAERNISPFKLPQSQAGNESVLDVHNQSSFRVPDFDRPSNFAHLVRTLPPPQLIRGCSLGMVDLDL